MKRSKYSIMNLLVLFSFALASLSVDPTTSLAMAPKKPTAPLATAESVDLDKYMGKWYEIAKLPQIFEPGCVGVTAEYSLKPGGVVSVKNNCTISHCGGYKIDITGTARSADSVHNSKLKLIFDRSFIFPFPSEGDYWILEVDPQYTYAIVGTADRQNFWILSRKPAIDETLYQSILASYAEQGFDISKVKKTQACE